MPLVEFIAGFEVYLAESPKIASVSSIFSRSFRRSSLSISSTVSTKSAYLRMPQTKRLPVRKIAMKTNIIVAITFPRPFFLRLECPERNISISSSGGHGNRISCSLN